MHRAWYLIVLLLLASAAPADRVELKDGQVLIGQVVRSEGFLHVRRGGRTEEEIPTDQIRRVVSDDQLRGQLRQKLAKIDPKDLDGRIQLGQWARDNGLIVQAEGIFREVLAVDGDHAEARRQLGFVRIDQRWEEIDEALRKARARLRAGNGPALLDSIAPALVQAARDRPERIEAMELLGRAQLTAARINQARATFGKLAASARRARDKATASRFKNLRAILTEHADGIYLLQEAYPAEAVLLGGEEYLRPGPVSLTHPLALDAAIRDRARRMLDLGRELIDQAAGLEQSDPERARAKYYRASLAFDQADALVPEVSRTYRIEIARRRISAIRQDIESEARRYDQLEEQLGAKELSDRDLRQRIERMIHHLASVEEGMDDILELARPYPQDLILEIQWARSDLRTVRQKRKILQDELDS